MVTSRPHTLSHLQSSRWFLSLPKRMVSLDIQGLSEEGVESFIHSYVDARQFSDNDSRLYAVTNHSGKNSFSMLPQDDNGHIKCFKIILNPNLIMYTHHIQATTRLMKDNVETHAHVKSYKIELVMIHIYSHWHQIHFICG